MLGLYPTRRRISPLDASPIIINSPDMLLTHPEKEGAPASCPRQYQVRQARGAQQAPGAQAVSPVPCLNHELNKLEELSVFFGG